MATYPLLNDRYEGIEKKLNSEFKKCVLGILLENKFDTTIDFAKLSKEKIPFFTFPQFNEEFNFETFLSVNGQEFYTFIESLLSQESQKLLLHLMTRGIYAVSINWDKCSCEDLYEFLIDIYADYLNWNLLIQTNDISPHLIEKHEKRFLPALFNLLLLDNTDACNSF